MKIHDGDYDLNLMIQSLFLAFYLADPAVIAHYKAIISGSIEFTTAFQAAYFSCKLNTTSSRILQ